LKKLDQGDSSNRPVEVQNAMLKRFFVELTHAFIIPLERYVASLMPLQKNVNPHKGAPVLGNFHTEDFIKSLDSSLMSTAVKGDWCGLYRRFCASRNFQGWYNQKRREANDKLQQLHTQALCHMDWREWSLGKQEVEVVDLILRMNDKLSAMCSTGVSGEAKRRLQHHIEEVITTLPADLQSVLKPS